MWPLIIGYRPGMEGSGDKDEDEDEDKDKDKDKDKDDDEQIMTTIRVDYLVVRDRGVSQFRL